MKNRPRRIECKQPIVGNSFPKSVVKDIVISELFLCIWPQRISLPRAEVTVCHHLDKKSQKYFAKMLKIVFAKEHALNSKKSLLVDKKSDFLDQEEPYFLRNLRKGNFIRATGTAKEQSYCFQGNFENELKFKEMLSLFTSDTAEELLSHYMHKNFDIISKQSFSFAIYLKINFSKRDSCYFFSREELPKNLPIYGIFVIGKVNSKKEEKVCTQEEIGKMWQHIVNYIEQVNSENKELGKQIKQRLVDELLKLEE